MPRNFKQRVGDGETLLGTFVKTPSPLVCEVLADSRLDCICLDAEHAPFDRRDIDDCVQVLRGAGMPALVRVLTSAPEHTLTALDCGAAGVVVPHVRSRSEAEEVARMAHFGRGGRGFAGSTRAAGFGTRTMKDHLEGSARETVVIAQIEDAEALDDIDTIAAVPGIDCLFVGRIDLTLSLGARSPQAPEVIEAVERICDAGARAGRTVGMFVGDLAECGRWRDLGASLFLLESDQGFLRHGAQRLVRRFAESDEGE